MRLAVPSMVIAPEIGGRSEAGAIVCTSAPGMLKAMVSASAAPLALASRIAWRGDPSQPSSVLVTVNVAKSWHVLETFEARLMDRAAKRSLDELRANGNLRVQGDQIGTHWGGTKGLNRARSTAWSQDHATITRNRSRRCARRVLRGVGPRYNRETSDPARTDTERCRAEERLAWR